MILIFKCIFKKKISPISCTRRLLGTILTVYIPTLLLIIISHMTNYFKPFFFEAVRPIPVDRNIALFERLEMKI